MDSRRCNLGWVLWRLANSRGLHKDASLDAILEQRRLYYEQKKFAARNVNGIPVESLAGVEDQDLTSRLKVYFEVKADVAQWEAEMVVFALENVETELMREESPWTDWMQCLAAHEWCVWRLEGLEPDVELGDADDPSEEEPETPLEPLFEPTGRYPVALAMDEVAIKRRMTFAHKKGEITFEGDVNVKSILEEDGFPLLDCVYDKKKLQDRFQELMRLVSKASQLPAGPERLKATEEALLDALQYYEDNKAGIKIRLEEEQKKLDEMTERYLRNNQSRHKPPVHGMFYTQQMDNMRDKQVEIATCHGMEPQAVEMGNFRDQIKTLAKLKDTAEQFRLTAEGTDGDDFTQAMRSRQATLQEAREVEKELTPDRQSMILAKIEAFLKCLFITQRRAAEQLLVFVVNDIKGPNSTVVAHFMVDNKLTGRDMNTVIQYVIWKLDMGSQQRLDVAAICMDGASKMVWARHFSGAGMGDPMHLLHLASQSLDRANNVMNAAKQTVGIPKGSGGDQRQKVLVKAIIVEEEMKRIQAVRNIPPITLDGEKTLHIDALLKPGTKATIGPARRALAELINNADVEAKKRHPSTHQEEYPDDYHAAQSLCTKSRDEGGLGWVNPSAGQVLRAYRSQRAITKSKVSVAGSMHRLAVSFNDEERVRLKRKGIDLDENFNDPKSTQGHGRFLFEDTLHKAKRIRCGVKNQASHDVGSEIAKGLALSRSVLLDTCDKHADHLQDIRHAILHPDSMNTAVCELMLRSEPLRKCLIEEGHVKEAEILKILGGAFIAFEQSGLDAATRDRLIQRQSDLVSGLFNNRLLDPVMAKDSHVAGMSRQLLYALRCNGDARKALMARYPELNICEQTLSSNECENLFSIINCHARQGGHHPGGEKTSRLMETVVRKQSIIRNQEEHGITIGVSNSNPYPQRMSLDNPTWNDGSLLGASDAAVTKRQKVDTKVEKEAKRVMQKHEDPRSGAKAKAVHGARA